MNYTKFDYMRKKVKFLGEMDNRLRDDLGWWNELLERNNANLADDPESDKYQRAVADCEAAIAAITDLRVMLEKQI